MNKEKTGLYKKFHGDYFVIDLDHDEFAKAAILVYAASCAVKNPVLAADLIRKLSNVPAGFDPTRVALVYLDPTSSAITIPDRDGQTWLVTKL